MTKFHICSICKGDGKDKKFKSAQGLGAHTHYVHFSDKMKNLDKVEKLVNDLRKPRKRSRATLAMTVKSPKIKRRNPGERLEDVVVKAMDRVKFYRTKAKDLRVQATEFDSLARGVEQQINRTIAELKNVVASTKA